MSHCIQIQEGNTDIEKKDLLLHLGDLRSSSTTRFIIPYRVHSRAIENCETDSKQRAHHPYIFPVLTFICSDMF